MSYLPFDAGSPTVVQTRQTAIDTTRSNLQALRDILVASGCAHGWAMSKSGGTADQPAIVIYARGTERVRVSITWGSTGGAAGNPTKVAYHYSINGGTSYDPLTDADGNYVMTLTWDAEGELTNTTWGATP